MLVLRMPEYNFEMVMKFSFPQAIDYGVSPDYLLDLDKESSRSDDWLKCASRHTGIPEWFLALAILAAALSALWLSFAPEKPNKLVADSNEDLLFCKTHVYLPDEAPLYKAPPPKYSEVDLEAGP